MGGGNAVLDGLLRMEFDPGAGDLHVDPALVVEGLQGAADGTGTHAQVAAHLAYPNV